MLFQASAMVILVAFYGFYISKLLLLNRRSIRTNQAGVGNKPRRVLLVERTMSVATILAIVMELGSIFLVKHPPIIPVRIAGLLTGVIAVIFFASATITMKDSWRVGIPEERTALVTDGIYQWSRNPAFVGFDLLYVSMCLLFFNIPLLAASLWAAVMLHLQILQEEDHMRTMIGEEYVAYTRRTLRYFGKRQMPNR